MIWYLPTLLYQALQSLLTRIVESLLFLIALLSVAYLAGWLDRLVWHLAETELSKLLNNTPVTIGSFRIDYLRGRAWVSNLVVHAPRRQQWQWESPLLGRIGSAYVETNLLQCILFDLLLREELPLEIYTLQLSDVQGFVERRQNVFNFYLCDPHLVLNEPEMLVDPPATTTVPESSSSPSLKDENFTRASPPNTSSSWDMAASESNHQNNMDATENTETSEKAQQLVEDMLRAVQTAAQRGQTLQGALVEHRDSLTTKLRELQGAPKKARAMKEGVKIAHEVTKAVVSKTQTAHQFVVAPPRRELPDEKVVYARFGRVVLEDARIFTRDHFDGSSNQPSSSSSSSSCWNKPIVIQQAMVRAAEFVPPLSAKDAHNDSLPAVYQPIEKCLDVVWKRVLAEIAKTNTGRLFQTAMGEVLDYYRMAEKDGSVVDSTAA